MEKCSKGVKEVVIATDPPQGTFALIRGRALSLLVWE